MISHNPMSMGLKKRINCGTALAVVFLLIAIALVISSGFMSYYRSMETLGGFIFAGMGFSSPVLWIAVVVRPSHMHVSLFLAWMFLLPQYPILGFVVGFFFPFKFELTRACIKQVLVRLALSILSLLGVGIMIGLYAMAHDS
jgi:hypothetical protein